MSSRFRRSFSVAPSLLGFAFFFGGLRDLTPCFDFSVDGRFSAGSRDFLDCLSRPNSLMSGRGGGGGGVAEFSLVRLRLLLSSGGGGGGGGDGDGDSSRGGGASPARFAFEDPLLLRLFDLSSLSESDSEAFFSATGSSLFPTTLYFAGSAGEADRLRDELPDDDDDPTEELLLADWAESESLITSAPRPSANSAVSSSETLSCVRFFLLPDLLDFFGKPASRPASPLRVGPAMRSLDDPLCFFGIRKPVMSPLGGESLRSTLVLGGVRCRREGREELVEAAARLSFSLLFDEVDELLLVDRSLCLTSLLPRPHVFAFFLRAHGSVTSPIAPPGRFFFFAFLLPFRSDGAAPTDLRGLRVGDNEESLLIGEASRDGDILPLRLALVDVELCGELRRER